VAHARRTSASPNCSQAVKSAPAHLKQPVQAHEPRDAQEGQAQHRPAVFHVAAVARHHHTLRGAVPAADARSVLRPGLTRITLTLAALWCYIWWVHASGGNRDGNCVVLPAQRCPGGGRGWACRLACEEPAGNCQATSGKGAKLACGGPVERGPSNGRGVAGGRAEGGVQGGGHEREEGGGGGGGPQLQDGQDGEQVDEEAAVADVEPGHQAPVRDHAPLEAVHRQEAAVEVEGHVGRVQAACARPEARPPLAARSVRAASQQLVLTIGSADRTAVITCVTRNMCDQEHRERARACVLLQAQQCSCRHSC